MPLDSMVLHPFYMTILRRAEARFCYPLDCTIKGIARLSGFRSGGENGKTS
jgi:hypothetical protein